LLPFHPHPSILIYHTSSGGSRNHRSPEPDGGSAGGERGWHRSSRQGVGRRAGRGRVAGTGAPRQGGLAPGGVSGYQPPGGRAPPRWSLGPRRLVHIYSTDSTVYCTTRRGGHSRKTITSNRKMTTTLQSTTRTGSKSGSE